MEEMRAGAVSAVVRESSKERRIDQFGCVGECRADKVTRCEMQDMIEARDMSVWGRMFNKISGTVENV